MLLAKLGDGLQELELTGAWFDRLFIRSFELPGTGELRVSVLDSHLLSNSSLWPARETSSSSRISYLSFATGLIGRLPVRWSAFPKLRIIAVLVDEDTSFGELGMLLQDSTAGELTLLYDPAVASLLLLQKCMSASRVMAGFTTTLQEI